MERHSCSLLDHTPAERLPAPDRGCRLRLRAERDAPVPVHDLKLHRANVVLRCRPARVIAQHVIREPAGSANLELIWHGLLTRNGQGLFNQALIAIHNPAIL